MGNFEVISQKSSHKEESDCYISHERDQPNLSLLRKLIKISYLHYKHSLLTKLLADPCYGSQLWGKTVKLQTVLKGKYKKIQ